MELCGHATLAGFNPPKTVRALWLHFCMVTVHWWYCYIFAGILLDPLSLLCSWLWFTERNHYRYGTAGLVGTSTGALVMSWMKTLWVDGIHMSESFKVHSQFCHTWDEVMHMLVLNLSIYFQLSPDMCVVYTEKFNLFWNGIHFSLIEFHFELAPKIFSDYRKSFRKFEKIQIQ